MDWQSHNDKSNHNRDVARILEGTGTSADWVVIALYYSVIHKVNAFLAKYRNLQGKPINHARRRKLVSSDRDLATVGIEYEFLETEAFQTRYNPTYSIPDLIVEETIRDADAIRDHIDSLL